MDAPSKNYSDGRVTLAVVVTELKNLTKTIEKQGETISKSCQEVRDIATQIAEWKHIPGDVAKLQDDVEGLQAKVNTWNGANTLGNIITGILAALGIAR